MLQAPSLAPESGTPTAASFCRWKRHNSSILSAGSAVFRDMFMVARAPQNSEDQVDGSPLIQLSDDSAEEMELVLDALYDRNFYKTEQKPFRQVAAMWRLGKKYSFDELRDDALRRLEHTFPSTLAKYQAHYYSAPANVKHLITPYSALVFDAINLARATGLVSILPAALYCACSTSPIQRQIHAAILSGLKGQDGKLVRLSDADRTLCILATSTLLEVQCALVYGWPGELRKTCGNPH
ncbi:hypothetical protein C8J57DRAFT_1459121, partial [Mycena rebaudengoi]